MVSLVDLAFSEFKNIFLETSNNSAHLKRKTFVLIKRFSWPSHRAKQLWQDPGFWTDFMKQAQHTVPIT